MDRDSRHLYDIAKLLPEIKITPELDDLIDEVREDRMQSKNNPSAQLEHDIPEMLKEIISSRFYEPDYNNITKKLLYEEVSYEDAIKKGIAVVADMDIFEYKRKTLAYINSSRIRILAGICSGWTIDSGKAELLTKCRFAAFGTEIMAIIAKMFRLKQKSGLHEKFLCYILGGTAFE